MKKFGELLGMLLVTLLFCMLTAGLVVSYIDEYDFTEMKPATVTVIEKTAAKGLFRSPAYYVKVQLPNGKPSPYLNRVSKRQIQTLEIGDEVKGYSAYRSDFSTGRDIVIDSLFYLFGFIVLGFISFCCIVAFILSIPAVERMTEKPAAKKPQKKKTKRRKRPKKWKKEKNRSGWGIACSVVGVFAFFYSRFLWNIALKILPFGKTSAEALILEQTSDVTYRKHQDSSYELTVAYRDASGELVHVIRDVTRNTFGQYEVGDMLPIAYFENDPYNIFVRGTASEDILQAVFYNEFYLYAAAIAVTAFVAYVYFKDRIKKRKKAA